MQEANNSHLPPLRSQLPTDPRIWSPHSHRLPSMAAHFWSTNTLYKPATLKCWLKPLKFTKKTVQRRLCTRIKRDFHWNISGLQGKFYNRRWASQCYWGTTPPNTQLNRHRLANPSPAILRRKWGATPRTGTARIGFANKRSTQASQTRIPSIWRIWSRYAQKTSRWQPGKQRVTAIWTSIAGRDMNNFHRTCRTAVTTYQKEKGPFYQTPIKTKGECLFRRPFRFSVSIPRFWNSLCSSTHVMPCGSATTRILSAYGLHYKICICCEFTL